MQSLDDFVTYNSTFHNWNVTTLRFDNDIYDNGINNTDLEQWNQFVLPWRQIIWTLLFVGMITVAIGGNLIVIWIVLAHRRMHTVTNYFLVNLSIADAMISTLNCIFNFIYKINNHWPFGTFYCKISDFIAVLTICASVFTLMAISIDRYKAIMNPLKPRMGKKATLRVIIVIWIVGAIFSLPMLFFQITYTENLLNGEVRIICSSLWPDTDDNKYSYDEYLYNIIFMILTFFLPIGFMIFNYVRVGLELWGSQSIGETTARQLEIIQSKRRVVKMMIVVVIIFVVCWLPYHIFFIVMSYLPEINEEPYINDVFLGIFWLAMSNSMYNPIIYCWMNTRFRRGFAQVFFWCPWVRVSAGEAVPVAFKGRDVQIQLHRTCTPEYHGMIEIRASCTTGSTTPRDESESHLKDIEPEQGTRERHP